MNQATYVSFSYPGYDAFAAEAIPTVSAALAALKPGRLNRVVYRYENELGLGRDADGSLALERIFPAIVPQVFAQGALSGPSRAVNAAFEHGWQAGGLTGVRGFHARAEDSGSSTVFRITVFGAVEGCSLSDLDRATVAAHRVSVELFEALISPSFRDFISSSSKE